MHVRILGIIAGITLAVSTTMAQTWPEELVLTPEKSSFTKTSTHAEVMDFLQSIVKKSSDVTLISMGKSKEGRDIPVAVLANPAIRSAEEARKSQKPVIYVQGNIHAGEVEGKEVLMMLMRDILLGDKHALLDNQILLFAPIYNTDSNDKMQPGLRPSQEDSPVETGIRENSQGLDLNRDGIKMEAYETQGLFQNIINQWDPQLFVDLHTTNGTWHGYALTWAPSYLSAGEAATYKYTNDLMLKSITKTAKEKYGLDFAGFGDYSVREAWPPKNFYTYNHHPRYLVNQFGLRNRMAILSESFAHERFYKRIYATYTFVYEILNYTNKHTTELKLVNKEAERAAIQLVTMRAGTIKKGVRFKMVPLEVLPEFRTYDYLPVKKADGSTDLVRMGNIVTYSGVNYYAKFEATTESTLPRGYVIPARFSNIAEHLKKMGATVETLNATKTFNGERFMVENLSRADRKFEGHNMARLTGTFQQAAKQFGAGDFVVDLAQPLANLIFYTLEPESDDGLATWNFFDAYLLEQGVKDKAVEYPIFKYFK